MDCTPSRREPSTPIFVGDKYVGRVENGVFVKHVRGTAHFLRTPKAICLGAQSLDDAEAAGADRVQEIDTETGNQYWARISHIRAHGFPVRRGHEPQIGLSFSHWRGADGQLPGADADAGPSTPPGGTPTPTAPDAPSRQLRLLEE